MPQKCCLLLSRLTSPKVGPHVMNLSPGLSQSRTNSVQLFDFPAQAHVLLQVLSENSK